MIPVSTICANGRWRSLAGPGPYTFDSTQSLANAALAISNQLYQGGPSASFAGGQYISADVLQHDAMVVSPVRTPL